MIANTPASPYSLRTEGDNGYSSMADTMDELAKSQPGYLGIESARNDLDITVSYWASEEAIANWKADLNHKLAQKLGKETWYTNYKVRICKVERDYGL